MRELRDKVAVITGAASGIGAALCRACADRGMKVVAADIEEAPLRELGDELTSKGAECLTVVTDVSSGDSVENLAGRAFDHFGAVHLLVNNAGVVVGGNSWEQSLDDYQWTFGVNFWGIVHGIRSFVPRFIDQGTEAHIVNVASMAGLTSAPGLAAYYASKHAVVSLSETLYFETTAGAHPNIGVSVLCPELVRTRIGFAKRNRPEHLSEEGPATDDRELYEESLRDLPEAVGVPPEQIAARTLSGVEQGRFYILPDRKTGFLDALRTRLDAIRIGENPEFVSPID